MIHNEGHPRIHGERDNLSEALGCMTIPGRTIQLGRIELLDPRSIWVNEAQDFTPWLLANADALADALGLDIELTAAEHPVGRSSLTSSGVT